MIRRNYAAGLCAALGLMVLILDSRTAISGAAEGAALCIQTLIPSLFPFFIFSIWMTNAFSGVCSGFFAPVGKLFRLPAGGENFLVTGFLGGYPLGAQSISIAYEAGQITREEARRLLMFCCNAGPSFLFGVLGSVFPERGTTLALWLIHIASSITVAWCLPWSGQSLGVNRNSNPALPGAMQPALKAMASVCGWVVLFRVILAFLDRWFLWMLPEIWKVLISGFLELANGCCSLPRIPDESLRFLVCSGMLAFGGLCVTMQTASVICGLPLKDYLCGKLFQTLFALIYSWAYLRGYWYIPLFVLVVFRFFSRNRKNPVAFPVKA